MAIQISAVICTFNRASYLRKAIQSLVDQTFDAHLYEILVVDNRSTDDTKRVVTEEFAHLPNLRYLYEPILGLSQARNTGWQNAKGEYVAYLDDDAIAVPHWLEKILEVFKTIKPQPGVVSGKVEPIWETAQPIWLSERILCPLTLVDWSEKPIFLSKKQWFAGANMAFPQHLLKAIRGFRVNLGRQGKKLLSNEEILIKWQLEGKGYRCFYHPEIVVQHYVPASKLEKNWLAKRYYWQGISDVVVQNHLKYFPRRKRLKEAASMTWSLLRSPEQLTKLLLPTDNPDRFEGKCFTLMTIGKIVGLLTIAESNS